jgi:hypothetical protein
MTKAQKFVPPASGQLPPSFRPTTHTSIRASDFGANVDAEWTTFAKCDPATGARTGQLPYWFIATCHVRGGGGRAGSVRLRDIGAQTRVGVLKLRVSGARKTALKVSRSSSGKGGKAVKLVNGFYAIEPSSAKGPGTPDTFYTLSFEGPLCFLECYNTASCAPRRPSGPGPLIEDGYPPSGTPQESQ